MVKGRLKCFVSCDKLFAYGSDFEAQTPEKVKNANAQSVGELLDNGVAVGKQVKF